MVSISFRHRPLAGIAVLGFMLAVAGCQSGDGAANLGVDAGADKSQEQITVSELRAYCPRVNLREGTAFYTTYAKGGDGDPQKVTYQAAITDVTRNCTSSGGMMTINVAAAGRVISGPAGAPGTITMPIRVAVLRGTEVIYSQLHKYQVTVGSEATQFVFNDPNVAIPVPDPGTVKVFVGYDDAPASKKGGNG